VLVVLRHEFYLNVVISMSSRGVFIISEAWDGRINNVYFKFLR
jgi:hypothetical protein